MAISHVLSPQLDYWLFVSRDLTSFVFIPHFVSKYLRMKAMLSILQSCVAFFVRPL